MRYARQAEADLHKDFEFKTLFQKQLEATKSKGGNLDVQVSFFRAHSDCCVWKTEVDMGRLIRKFPQHSTEM